MSTARPSHSIRASFMPLLDAAPLIVAARHAPAAEAGVAIKLERETSWATLRDRIAVGQVDVAHMLAPMPIAANLGLTPLSVRLLVPMALGFGGNTITVSAALWQDMMRGGLSPGADLADPRAAGQAFGREVARRRRTGMPKLVVAVVHTHSAHYYQFAYWLAAAGVDPDRDVDLVVVPPSLTTAAMDSGQIDAFCAGEPWGSIARDTIAARVLVTNTSIWRSSPEKVLAVRAAWCAEESEATYALVRAVHRAALWCDDPANADALAELLAAPDALALPAPVLAASLRQRFATDGTPTGFLAFARQSAAFPWLSHAAWFYTQMVRCRQVPLSGAGLATARATYRPDLYRRALGPQGVDLPSANSKVEGRLSVPTAVGSTGGRLMLGPDTFFDGATFDPDDIEGYLARSGDA